MNVPRNVDAELTLVIPTLGRTSLRGTLAAVAAGTRWPAQVIVADQGREAWIGELAAEYRNAGLWVRHLPSASSGRSAGLNLGIAAATTRFIAITDDDCLPAPDWIAGLGERLRRHDPALVTGRVEAGEGEVQLAVVTSREEVIQRRPSLRFDRLSGGNMGMARAQWQSLGPFAEQPAMRTAEDGEFAYRALRAGVPIVYAPELVVQHLGWRDEPARNAQYRSYGLSQAGFYGHYLRRGDAFILLRVLVHLLRSSRRWLSGTLRGDHDAARHGRAQVLGLWPGLRAGWRSGDR